MLIRDAPKIMMCVDSGATDTNGDDLPRLFNTEGAWAFNMWDFLRDHRYVDAFRRGAEVLMTRSLESNPGTPELTMPILFCYRHWVELRLKSLWILSGDLRQADVKPLKGHDIRKLWSSVRPIIQERWPDSAPRVLDRAEAVLHELADNDPIGTAFRYPTHLDGQDTLTGGFAVDLVNVREVMDELYLFFEDAATAIQK